MTAPTHPALSTPGEHAAVSPARCVRDGRPAGHHIMYDAFRMPQPICCDCWAGLMSVYGGDVDNGERALRLEECREQGHQWGEG